MSSALADQLAVKHQVARKSTFVSIVLNTILVTLQISIGLIAHSQALVADGVHSLADLVSDFVVLAANRHSDVEPDADHNYGHSRYETVASLFLGALLITVGIGMLWRAGERLTDIQNIPTVHLSALAVAILVLCSKEALFRYMLREAQRVRSAMLIANAWHARSDAASSLVVALGIIGSLAGIRLLDPIAAAIVGFMVARMGWTFGWDALQDLSDRALDERATADVLAQLSATPGVRDVHGLRTRKMGDFALVDAHILVDPLISVSEGHYIAESARARVLAHHRVLDALIHVDPENDLTSRPPVNLPSRERVVREINTTLARHKLQLAGVTLHYLTTGLDVDITLKAADGQPSGEPSQLLATLDVAGLKQRLGAHKLSLLWALNPTPAITDGKGEDEDESKGNSNDSGT
ncbi:cation diffusion facilitator family transporter [Paraburkholderia bonniea]|uniref:cation diffusion facilitator family transporter n=1 Tax=Paraburkholderia bonniea TaxID=2152891 RepID=UPI00129195E2|nr:cation diffusion facilitator family transporter [Paraburkholderia bonniea]WJF90199.1 cation diffusion facilitator family transporter [Paraburkholderia bonniea]WJF93513.1 cation diffusion facilitator family transporter [Paraburkholderia bonniea]